MTIAIAVLAFVLALLALSPRSLSRLQPTKGNEQLQHRKRRGRRNQQGDTIAALSAFSSEVRVGTPPRVALTLALEPHPELCPDTQRALKTDTDVVAALRRDAVRQGASEWNTLATVWQLSEERGVALRPVADQLAEYSRQVVGMRQLLAAELAEATSTMRVLAMLPLAGLALGMLLGSNPIGWLVTSAPGRLMLAAAIGLELLGWAWVRSIVRRVQRRV
jgi:tight adherence protein B